MRGSHRANGATPDAVVVGAGPNGLAAAIGLAEAGRRVVVRERAGDVGGAARSAALTLPGFVHDVGSAVHPLAAASPLLTRLPLEDHGLRWIHPAAPLAHPLPDGTAVLLHGSLWRTAEELGADAGAYARLILPLVNRFRALVTEVLAPPLHVPRHPILLARLARRALPGARALARSRFGGERARALLAGVAAHANVPLDRTASSSVALLLTAAAHAVGWPSPEGGAGRITAAMADHLRDLGGEVHTDAPVESLSEIPHEATVLASCTPRQLADLGAGELPERYRRRLSRYRYGPGVFKMDWALSAPIPWRAPECALAGTVHVGGGMDEIAAVEEAAWRGRHSDRPFLILSQPTLFDPSRAPGGRHVAWAYCHVPHGSDRDVSRQIEAQIERFAPGFSETVLARRAWPPSALEALDANLVGGDIGGGALDGAQFLFRPSVTADPYATPARRLFICSSATPPGPGVHGMCGALAARCALRRTGRGPRDREREPHGAKS